MDVSTPTRAARPFEVTNWLVLSIAVPMTLAYLTTPLLGITDTAVIGQYGDAALLGGLAAGAIVFDVVFTTFNFLRSGTTGLVAQAFGRDDVLEEQAVLWRALAIALVCGLLVVALGPLVNAAGVRFMNPDPRVAEAMHAYVAIRILGAPLSLINYAILGYVLGRGEGGLGLGLQVILNGANIALSVFLGLSLGWGIEGVAWGTVGGEALGALAGFGLLAWRFRNGPRVSLARVFDFPEIMRMVAMNRDIMIRSFSLLAAFALFTRQGAQFGTVTLAANAVLMNFFLIAGYFLDGMATAAEQLAGRAVGARYRPAFRQAVWLTIVWGFGLALALAGVFVLFGDDLVAFIAKAEDVREIASVFLPWAALIAVSGVLAFQMDGVFIGATWSRDMRNMMLLSLAVYLVCLFFLTRAFGNYGLWATLHIFLIVRGISLAAILPARARQTFGS
ncbi:MATE family efflux transporter [Nitratireductor aquimarinus]|uniref:MATE family efflux transporter n=1 Tax=Nitratireductor aquimarinus TaxID=889300 RepID=UPI001A8F5437|nr:MATE family efflux transporter [Nitratireductor aquimarinus]MBN8243086.1 MATE family efflux transporter [Nitratireductor aquimarinus]MBY6130987.1 MATE family efflux transporter [Nitratireductor aquimarinus]MCA1302257.1 MATE family efflux transporter [Nitratireductor aquimarinus]